MKYDSIILYLVDSVWNTWNSCYCYTSIFSGRTEIEIDSGTHTIEFKYPIVGWGGRIYRATFNTEIGKIYEITKNNTNDYYPMVINKTDKSIVEGAVIKQISVPKSDSKTLRLPNVEKNNFSTITSSCCSGFYSTVDKFMNLGGALTLFKIDDIWGPYSTGWDVAFNSALDGQFNIELSPGFHKFYIAVYPGTGFHMTNLKTKIKGLTSDYFYKNIVCIYANLEKGKTYGFDYLIFFNTPKASSDFYYDIKIVEVSDNLK